MNFIKKILEEATCDDYFAPKKNATDPDVERLAYGSADHVKADWEMELEMEVRKLLGEQEKSKP